MRLEDPAGLRVGDVVYISDDTQRLLKRLHALALISLRDVLEANELIAHAKSGDDIKDERRSIANRVIDRKGEVTKAMDAIYTRTGERLTKAYATEADIIEAIKSIFFISRNVAKIMNEEHEEKE